jgi:hypothetical protein
MGNVRGDTLSQRLREWDTRLGAGAKLGVKAIDLYAGNSWSVVKRICASPKIGPSVRLWIVSAGCGLLTADMKAPPYSATFTKGDPDFVLRGHDEAESHIWWQLLSNGRSWVNGKFKRMSDVARVFPVEPLIVVVSVDYLGALQDDIAKARMYLQTPDSLVIISAGAKKEGVLAANFLPCDSRLEHRFGRGRMALNTRILESVLISHLNRKQSFAQIKGRYGKMLALLPRADYPKRERSSDDQVRAFVNSELRKKSDAKHTSLLRLYRSGGLGCEQSRFRDLFREVASEMMPPKRR